MIKFRHIITLIVTLTTFFSLQQANAGERIRLRVMSMNIKEGAAYASHKAAPYAELIKKYDPDVVCLQEVDYMTTRNGREISSMSSQQQQGCSHIGASRSPIREAASE